MKYVAKNLTNQTFREETQFERCNIVHCEFLTSCHFDRCNVIDCVGTDECSSIKSNICDVYRHNPEVEVVSTDIINDSR